MTTRQGALNGGRAQLLLTEPWQGSVDLAGVGFALAAGTCWGLYNPAAQRDGQRDGRRDATVTTDLPASTLKETP